jgi:ABC-type phosphate transport system permease subunit
MSRPVGNHPGGAVSSSKAPHTMPETAPVTRRKFSFLDAIEKPFEWLIRICGWSSIIGIIAIFLFIFKEAWPMIPKLDWWTFFTSSRWIPNPAPGNPASFGALGLIVGTLSVTGISLLIAVPVGLGAAVYISEFAKGKTKETLKVIIELLAAIPSIVWGFIGLMVLGPLLKDMFTAPIQPVWGIIVRLLLAILATMAIAMIGNRMIWKNLRGFSRATAATILPTVAFFVAFIGFGYIASTSDPFVQTTLSGFWSQTMMTLHFASAPTGAAQGTNLLTGGIILALMSVPVIVSLAEDALRAVPDSFREASLALGANPWETVRRVLFPAARNGLLAACLLGMGRAVGETMAVLLASGHSNRIPESMTDPVRTMTATIAAEMGEAVHGSEHYQMLFILGIVLFVVTCAINVASDLIVKGVKKANKA